jgi:hypothetical protein
MGWVVYNQYGVFIKYYKKPGPAKAAVTRYHKAIAETGYSYPQAHGCCEYRAYEGILLGLKEGSAELKLWQFCNKGKG